MQITPWLIVNVIMIGVIAPLSIYTLQRYLRRDRRSDLLAFGIMTLGIVMWELNSILVETVMTVAEKVFWLNFGNAVTVPILLYGFLWFALAYSRSEWIDIRWIGGLAATHVLLISPLFLLRPEIWYEASGLLNYGPLTILGLSFQEWLVLDLTHQMPFKLYQVYIYAMTILGGIVLFRYLYRNGGTVSREQTVLVAIGVFAPLLGNALLFVDIVPPALNTTDLAFGVTGIAFGIAMFRYRLFDLVPMGRERLVETMSDPVIMLDGDGRVVDCNAAARTLSDVSAGWRGTPAAEFLAPFSDLLDRLGATEPVESELEISTDGTVRYFDLDVSMIEPSRRRSGQLIVLRDVTERKVRERQLEAQRNNLNVLNTMMRHDIRNDLQLVTAYTGVLAEYVTGDGVSYLEQIQSASENAIEITKTARDVTDVLLKAGEETKPIPLRPTLEGEIEEARRNSAEALITVSGSIDSVRVEADELLESVFRNLLTNAIEHNDTTEPSVEVSTTRTEETIQIAIADNGPGVPPDLRDSIFQEGETGLESEGTGLGLYLVETLVDRYDGNVWIEANEPRGAVFVVELPVIE